MTSKECRKELDELQDILSGCAWSIADYRRQARECESNPITVDGYAKFCENCVAHHKERRKLLERQIRLLKIKYKNLQRAESRT